MFAWNHNLGGSIWINIFQNRCIDYYDDDVSPTYTTTTTPGHESEEDVLLQKARKAKRYLYKHIQLFCQTSSSSSHHPPWLCWLFPIQCTSSLSCLVMIIIILWSKLRQNTHYSAHHSGSGLIKSPWWPTTGSSMKGTMKTIKWP